MCQAFDGELRDLRAENDALRREVCLLRGQAAWAAQRSNDYAEADSALRTLASVIKPYIVETEYDE